MRQLGHGNVGFAAVRADDLPAIVDARRKRAFSSREIDRGDGVAAPQETVRRALGIDVPAHRVASGVDAEDDGERGGAGGIDGGEDIRRRERTHGP